MRLYALKTTTILALTETGYAPATPSSPPTVFSCPKKAQEESLKVAGSIVVEIEIIEKKRKSFNKEKFFSRYKTYEGPSGSPEEWRAQAEILVSKLGSEFEALSILQLTTLPASVDDLKKARRNLMSSAHPDKGGDTSLAAKINQAFELLEPLIVSKKEATSLVVRPMLAETIEDVSALTFPLYASPKLDGIRCLKLNGKAVSRQFKTIPNRFTANWMAENLPDGLDGELMLEGKTFNEIQSEIMSMDGEPDFQYWVFDFVDQNLKEEFHIRHTKLQEKIKNLDPKRVKLVPQILVSSAQELLDFEQKCLDEGYEGVMVRSVNSPYKCGRSSLSQGYLLKLKRFSDSEAEIIGFEELLHNHNTLEKNELGLSKRSRSKAGMVNAGSLGKFKVRDIHTNQEFEIGTGEGLTQKLRKEIWENQTTYLGRLIKYKYQKAGQKDLPRFPVWLGFRDPRDLS